VYGNRTGCILVKDQQSVSYQKPYPISLFIVSTQTTFTEFMRWLLSRSARANRGSACNIDDKVASTNHSILNGHDKESRVGTEQPAPFQCEHQASPVDISPEKITELGYLYVSSRVFLTAVEIELFTKLASAPGGSMTNSEIREVFEFHPRATPDFTDCLVSLNVLQHAGDNPATARYSNTPESALFLDKKRDSYIGKTLETASRQWYWDWADHPSLLKNKSRKTDKLKEVIKGCNQDARVKLFYSGRVGSTGLSLQERNLSPNDIFELGFGFWNSRILLTAVEWRLFTMIEAAPKHRMSLGKIERALDLRKSTAEEFLDALVQLEMLDTMMKRTADGEMKKYYKNTAAGRRYLDRSKPQYVGGAFEMYSARVYRFFADLLCALQTGQSEPKYCPEGTNIFTLMQSNPEMLEEFMSAMIGMSQGAFEAFSQGRKALDFSAYKTLCDIGGASGQLACYVTQAHPHLRAITTDLPAVIPIAERWIERHGCTDRVTPVVNDFFVDDFPKAKVITMAMILHDWNLLRKKLLIRKAYEALPEGGVFVSIEAIIDNERRMNRNGLCMSLHMLIEFGADGGFDFTGNDFDLWCKEASFRRTEVVHLLGPTSAAIAYK
jgi:O-methyltransferase domain/Dimerisation domain